MTEREEFEAWVKSRGGDCMKKGTPGEPMYLSSMTREWWAAWKARAARAAPAQPAERVRVFRWPINGGGMSDWVVVTNPNEKQSAHCEYAWATIERIEP